jgi:hypothetical protein
MKCQSQSVLGGEGKCPASRISNSDHPFATTLASLEHQNGINIIKIMFY